MYKEKQDNRRRVQPVKQQLVVATYEMDTATFAKHFTYRHRDSLGDMHELPARIDFGVEQAYRAFHWRIHGSMPVINRTEPAPRDGLDHYHEPDPPESGIDRAIECLIENHTYGWQSIAGVEGVIAVFPSGQIATRVQGAMKHHRTIEEASDRLMEATRKAHR